MTYLTLGELSLAKQRVLIREDLNVPMKNGRITNDARIQAALPTLRQALEQNAAVMVMSHLGRPTEGQPDEQYSLAPVAHALAQNLNQPVRLVKDWLDGVQVAAGELVVLENVRFLKGEKGNDDSLAKRMAALCDVFVMDAFATAHRAQASTCGVANYAPIACAGPLLDKELTALSRAILEPKSPVVAIVGGAKVSSKLTVLSALSEQVDQLIVGGGIANTFMAAAGLPVGQSLQEPSFHQQALALRADLQSRGADLPLPEDVVCARYFRDGAETTVKAVDHVAEDEMILDVGPKTAASYRQLLQHAATIIWNGPVGVFEFANCHRGTQALAQAIADSDGFSLAGGGDTIAAIDQFKVRQDIDYISTGGGAFLEFLEGKDLPAVTTLQKRYQQNLSNSS